MIKKSQIKIPELFAISVRNINPGQKCLCIAFPCEYSIQEGKFNASFQEKEHTCAILVLFSFFQMHFAIFKMLIFFSDFFLRVSVCSSLRFPCRHIQAHSQSLFIYLNISDA